MTSPGYGFFMGGLPGGIFVLVNMCALWRRFKIVRSMAIAEGQDWDLHLDMLKQLKILKDRNEIFKNGESFELRKAKENLLKAYSCFMVRHLAGAGLFIVGAFLGAFLMFYM